MLDNLQNVYYHFSLQHAHAYSNVSAIGLLPYASTKDRLVLSWLIRLSDRSPLNLRNKTLQLHYNYVISLMSPFCLASPISNTNTYSFETKMNFIYGSIM